MKGEVVATVHVGLTESDSNGRTTDGLNVKAVRGSYGGGEIRRDGISQCEAMSLYKLDNERFQPGQYTGDAKGRT